MDNGADQLLVECRVCGVAQPLDAFRLFSASPLLYMDFCAACERREGTLALYRRFHGYATPAIAAAVFAAERTPAARRTAEQARLLVDPATVSSPQTQLAVLQREFARRELIRRRFLYFVTSFQSDYKPGWVHQDIARRLEVFVAKVERGESPRLMLFMPPRTGKSELVSKKLVAWVLGMHPEWMVLGASYAQSLPVSFSRDIRDVLSSQDYEAVFPGTTLRSDNKGVEEWRTTRGGGYIAAGVGVGITGRGMHIGILDDPLRDQEAAQSEVIRTSTFDWYQAVFRTRLAPGGGIIVVMTRWHDKDPAGELLTREEELRKQGVPEVELDNWDVVSYPAIANNDEWLLRNGTIWNGTPDAADQEGARLLRRKGDALHPERYSLKELLQLKRTLAPSIWSSLYQQNPTPDDGEYFRRADLRYRPISDDEAASARIFVTFDFAISKRAKNDFTVGGVFALTKYDDLFLLDIVRGRWNALEIVDMVVQLVAKWSPEVFAGERGAIYEALWPLIKAALTKQKLVVSFDETLLPLADKEVRARPLQARVQSHRFIVDTRSTDRPAAYDELEKEMLRFPTGTYDDIVDMLAWGARLAMNMSLPSGGSVMKPRSTWKDRLPVSAPTSHMAA